MAFFRRRIMSFPSMRSATRFSWSVRETAMSTFRGTATGANGSLGISKCSRTSSGRLVSGSGIFDKYGNELEFTSAFRQCRRNGKPRGIVKNQVWRSAMIRNESEYQEASARLTEERKRPADHRARLKEAGLGDEEIKR